MAKVMGIHQLELRAGVDPSQVERACAEIVAAPMYRGWRAQVLKGERGIREGKYVLLFEIDSVEDRDRIFPQPDQLSEEARQFDAEHPDGSAAWERFSELVDWESDDVTDYIVVAE